MNRKELIVGVLLGVVIIYVAVSFVVEKRLSAVDAETETKLMEVSDRSVELSKLLAQGAATVAVSQMVPDCPVEDMVAYDSLLSSLDKGLSYADTVKLSELFSVCGDVAAKRRSVMTLLLAEQVESMNNLATIRTAAKLEPVNEVNIEKWQELAKKETQISDLFVRLVMAQESIIVALTKGVPATSITVENIRSSAQKLREEMITLTNEVVTLRTELGAS